MSKEEIKKLEEDIKAFEEDKQRYQTEGQEMSRRVDMLEQQKQIGITKFRQIEGKLEMLDDLISRRREKIKELKKSKKEKKDE